MATKNKFIDIEEISKVVDITDSGKIFNKKTGKELKQFIQYRKTSKGYWRVNIPGHGKFLVHRLVAMKYNPNDNQEYLTVNHIDEDTWNNNKLNVEWMTSPENTSSGAYWFEVVNQLSEVIIVKNMPSFCKKHGLDYKKIMNKKCKGSNGYMIKSRLGKK